MINIECVQDLCLSLQSVVFGVYLTITFPLLSHLNNNYYFYTYSCSITASSLFMFGQ